MEKRHKIFAIVALTSFLVLLLLFAFGIQGLSIKGRVVERVLLLIFLSSYFLLIYTSFKFKKSKTIIILPLIPVIISMFNPLLFLHFAFMLVHNSFNNDKIYFEDDEIKIVQGQSFSTDDFFLILKEESIFEVVEGSFNLPLNEMENYSITYDSDSIYVSGGEEHYSAEIKKSN